jgi:hypothetical protein
MLRFVDQCLITTLLDTFTEFMNDKNEKYIIRNNFSSNEAIKFFGSRRSWRVGRKGETNTILFFIYITTTPNPPKNTHYFAICWNPIPGGGVGGWEFSTRFTCITTNFWNSHIHYIHMGWGSPRFYWLLHFKNMQFLPDF